MLLWEIAEEKLPFHNEKDILEIRNLVVQKMVRPVFNNSVPHEWVKISHKGIERFITNLSFLFISFFFY